jgi:fructosamine-3-kinase
MNKMKLNLSERLTILGILPKEGSFVTLQIIRDLQKNLSPTEEEFKEFEIKQDAQKIGWNAKGAIEKEIKLGEKAQDIVVEVLKELDKNKKLSLQHVSLWEKFVKN